MEKVGNPFNGRLPPTVTKSVAIFRLLYAIPSNQMQSHKEPEPVELSSVSHCFGGLTESVGFGSERFPKPRAARSNRVGGTSYFRHLPLIS